MVPGCRRMMGATDRLPSACDRCFDDRITVRSGINKDSGSFILPAFPSRVAPVGTGALGLFPELCPRPLPATYVRAGRVWNTHPKLRLRHHAEPPIDEPAQRRGERELRPGCLDAAEARGRALGRPGARRPRAIGGTGTSPGSSSSRGSGWRRLGPRNVGAAGRRDQTLPAVTLSDTGVRGERAHSRRSVRGWRLGAGRAALRRSSHYGVPASHSSARR